MPAARDGCRDLQARDTLVADNSLVGPFNATAVALRTAIFGGNSTAGGIIRGNQIRGTGTESGITLLGAMNETGVVMGNVVDGASSA